MPRSTSNQLSAAFTQFQHSAFRLETLDRYAVPEEAEALRRFLAGEPQDSSWREPWVDFVRGAVAAGKRMSRVHMVTEPLNDYLRFELTCGYPANVEAGEDIRIIRRQDWPGPAVPGQDFWLFDNQKAAFMNYGEAGDFRGAEVTTDPAVIEDCRQAHDRLVRHSVPLLDYLAKS